MKVLESGDRLQGSSLAALGAYAHRCNRTLLTHARDSERRRSHRELVFVDLLPDPSDPTALQLDVVRLMKELDSREAAARRPGPERPVLQCSKLLWYALGQGIPPRQLAEEFERSPNAISQRLSKCRRRAREIAERLGL